MTSPRVIGVIGGMGPLATQVFYECLIRQTDAKRDQDHLHVVINSDPVVPDRTAFLLGRGPDPRPAIKESARLLTASGAELLVMPCNTANVWAAEVAEACGAPIIDWFEVAVDSVRNLSWRSVALLATSGTIEAAIYQRLFRRFGIATIVPSEQQQEVVMDAIYGRSGVKATGEATAATRTALREVVMWAAAEGANGVLLGCTELPLAFKNETGLPVPLLDPAVAVARRAITQAGGRVRRDPASTLFPGRAKQAPQ